MCRSLPADTSPHRQFEGDCQERRWSQVRSNTRSTLAEWMLSWSFESVTLLITEFVEILLDYAVLSFQQALSRSRSVCWPELFFAVCQPECYTFSTLTYMQPSVLYHTAPAFLVLFDLLASCLFRLFWMLSYGLIAFPASRIVKMASLFELLGTINWDDLEGYKSRESGVFEYSNSKIMVILGAREINKRLKVQNLPLPAYSANLLSQIWAKGPPSSQTDTPQFCRSSGSRRVVHAS